MNLTEQIKSHAQKLGFDLVGIIPAEPSKTIDCYERWLENGYAGEMAYLERHLPLKRDARNILPETTNQSSRWESIIILSIRPKILPRMCHEDRSLDMRGEGITTTLSTRSCVGWRDSLREWQRKKSRAKSMWIQGPFSNVNTPRTQELVGLAKIPT